MTKPGSSSQPRGNSARASNAALNAASQTERNQASTTSDTRAQAEVEDYDYAPSKGYYYAAIGLISMVLGLYIVSRLWDDRGLRGILWGLLSWAGLAFIVFNLFYSLHQVRTVSPGVVTPETKIKYTYERKANGAVRYCRKSRLRKPDRAHYCHATRRLIMRFDHNCVFLDASIGIFNHRYFLLFLAYASLGSAYIALDTILGANPFSAEARYMLPTELYVIMFIVIVLSSALCVSLGLFLGYHIYLAANGWTTVEASEQQGFNPRTGRARLSKPYKLPTFMDNLKQIMGTDIKTWLLPFCETKGLPDGVHWEYQGLIEHEYPAEDAKRNVYGSAY